MGQAVSLRTAFIRSSCHTPVIRIKRSPNGHPGESEVEIRQIFEPEDFAPAFSEEGIRLEKTIRAQLADRAAKK